jgi:hypothetical protein
MFTYKSFPNIFIGSPLEGGVRWSVHDNNWCIARDFWIVASNF